MAGYLRTARSQFDPQVGSAKGLPTLTSNLDSIRVYNWEVNFNGANAFNPTAANEALTLAAKRVQSAGHSVEDIPVRRLNDLYHYPGAANNKELIITFDHLLYEKPVETLYNWFRNGSYNIRNGVVANARESKIHSIDILYYDNTKTIQNVTSYYGVFVAAFEPGEHNYSTANDFHTFDVTFRYDFMEYTRDAEATTF